LELEDDTDSQTTICLSIGGDPCSLVSSVLNAFEANFLMNSRSNRRDVNQHHQLVMFVNVYLISVAVFFGCYISHATWHQIEAPLLV